MSLAAGSVARQARRIRWLGQDLAACVGAIVRIAAHSRRADAPVGIGLLEGDARAVEGRLNGYRIRLVNETAASISVTLHVRGETDTHPSFATRADYVLAPRALRVAFLVSDWVDRFELGDAASTIDALASAIGPEPGRQCRVAARLESANELLEEIAIWQPLVACASST